MESEMLSRAETVIQVQRANIDELTATVLKLNESIRAIEETNSNQVAELLAENERLRLYLDALNAESAASGELTSQNELALREMSKSLASAEKQLKEKDAILLELQSRMATVPLQNKQISDQLVLSNLENERLKKKLEHCKTSNLSLNCVSQLLEPISIHRENLLGKLGYSIEESHVTKKCLIQVESELSEIEKLADEQRKEIKWLYQVIDSLKKEKALLPPIISIQAGRSARGARLSRNAADQLIEEEKLSSNQYKDFSLREEYKDRSLSTSAQTTIQEHRNLLSRVLKALDTVVTRQIKQADSELKQWKSDTDIFYRGRILHAVSEPNDKSPSGFTKRIMAVKLSNLYLFDDPTDDAPLVHLRAHKVTRSSVDAENFEIKLHYLAGIGTKEEVHTFRFGDSDEFQRWYHAFQYGGFIRDPQPEVLQSSYDGNDLKLDVFVPNGIGTEGTPLPTELKKCNIVHESDTNTIRFKNLMAPQAVTIPCSSCTYKAKPQYNEIIIQHPNTKIRIQAEDKEKFSLALSICQKAHWNESLSNKEPNVPSTPELILTPPNGSEDLNAAAKPQASSLAPSSSEQDKADREAERVASEQEDAQKASNEGLFVIKDGKLMIYESSTATEPSLQLSNQNCVTSTNEKEITITANPNTSSEESYVFLLNNESVFKYWCDELEKNGFKKNVEGSRRAVNQTGVVTKDLLELYKYYGSPGAKPIMSLAANMCTATASEERREIRITKQDPSGKTERITLDCSNKTEFERWKVALTFGGFISEGSEGYVRSFGNLSKYVFPIKLFDEHENERRSALEVTKDELLLFPTPEAKEPLLTISQDDCEVQTLIEQRKIRIYTHRYTTQEERLDLIFFLAKDFDRVKKKLDEHQFKEAVGARRVSKTQIPFVLCKKGSIVIYKDKYQQTPEFSIDKDKYTASIDQNNLMITFTPMETAQSDKCFTRALACADRSSFNRWDLTLKFSMFKSMGSEEPPKYFFPYINYGHICPEAMDLSKPFRRRSSGMDFFRFSSALKAKNENDATESNASSERKSR